MDRGHRYTDKRIELLEKQLDRHYKRTSAEAKRQLKKWLKKHQPELQDMWDRMDNGENVDVDSYIYKRMKVEIDRLADFYAEADQKAMSIVGASMGAIFVYNYNDMAKRLKRKTGKDIPLIKDVI